MHSASLTNTITGTFNADYEYAHKILKITQHSRPDTFMIQYMDYTGGKTFTKPTTMRRRSVVETLCYSGSYFTYLHILPDVHWRHLLASRLLVCKVAGSTGLFHFEQKSFTGFLVYPLPLYTSAHPSLPLLSPSWAILLPMGNQDCTLAPERATHIKKASLQRRWYKKYVLSCRDSLRLWRIQPQVPRVLVSNSEVSHLPC